MSSIFQTLTLKTAILAQKTFILTLKTSFLNQVILQFLPLKNVQTRTKQRSLILDQNPQPILTNIIQIQNPKIPIQTNLSSMMLMTAVWPLMKIFSWIRENLSTHYWITLLTLWLCKWVKWKSKLCTSGLRSLRICVNQICSYLPLGQLYTKTYSYFQIRCIFVGCIFHIIL